MTAFYMARYYLSRVLFAACLLLALRASLWAAGLHSSVLPVLLWGALACLALLIHPHSMEGHAEPAP